MRIGLFGGSFNPPHIGHALVCFYLLETTSLDAIWLIPTWRHAFGKPLAPYEERLELCRRMARSFGGRLQVSDVEGTRGEVSYTIDTVRTLHAQHPDATFEWIIGADILRETERWKDYPALKELITFRVLGRGGYPGGSEPAMPEVSSTEIRDRLRQGLPVDGLVPNGVLEYILERGLYHRSDNTEKDRESS